MGSPTPCMATAEPDASIEDEDELPDVLAGSDCAPEQYKWRALSSSPASVAMGFLMSMEQTNDPLLFNPAELLVSQDEDVPQSLLPFPVFNLGDFGRDYDPSSGQALPAQVSARDKRLSLEVGIPGSPHSCDG